MATVPPIVGIGASAGGLEALQAFVQAIPNDSGIAYVIVQHLARNQPSLLAKLLGAHATLPVLRIENGGAIAPDTVHVIPPAHYLDIENGRFRLTPIPESDQLRAPIDRFFASLAEADERGGFGIVLSGTGSDGTAGIRAIKAAGGIAMVQESHSARFAGMPDSAAATGLVDVVLRPGDMPQKILQIVEHRRAVEDDGGREELLDRIEARLGEILECLDADSTGHSFTGYKPGTLVRRVARRMTLLRQRTVDGYLETLRSRQEERTLLTQDFLIGVTQFFRDPETFSTLSREVLTKLLSRDQPSFRIWVPGCSSGEEAYSLAMLVTEIMEAAGDTRPCKIFGTDIDLDALRQARSGRYSDSALQNISDERRERFFGRDEEHWHVRTGLRETCVFAPHNLLHDPPFSKLDLVSCRNVMIYLNVESQEALLQRFHYALNPGGYLWLGPSESLGRKERYFRIVDRTARIFQRDDRTPPSYSAAAAQLSPTRIQPSSSWTPLTQALRTGGGGIEAEAEQAFLHHASPPFAAIDRHNEVIYVSEAMADFVRPARGAVGMAIEDYLRQELRLPAHGVVTEARRTQARAEVRNVVVEMAGGPRLFDLIARPMVPGDERVLLSMIEVRARDLEASGELPLQPQPPDFDRELALTRKRVVALQQEYESAEQELRATNEELLSMNEELQSSNEELETSREELQSINEELETINAELSENNRQLGRANSDLNNLLESTDIATLFIDERDCVRLFTPEVSRLFGVQDRDIGRSIHDLASKVDYPQLKEDAADVQRSLQPIERELQVPATGETFQARVRPYRTVDNRLDGVVITFVDITARKDYERKLEENARLLSEQYAELEVLYDTTPVGLCVLDRDLKWLRINPMLAEINGFTPEEHIGKSQAELIPAVHEAIADIQRRVLETGEPVLGVTVRGQTPHEPGITREWIDDFFPIRAGDEVFAVGCAVREVTEQRALERQVFESEARMRRLFDQAPVAISMHEGPDFVTTYSNPRNQMEIGGREIIGLPVTEAMPELDGSPLMQRMAQVFATGQSSDEEQHEALVPHRRETGDAAIYRNVLEPWFDADGKVVGVISFSLDITDQVKARQRDVAEKQRLQRLHDSLAAYVGLVSPDGTLLEINAAALERSGVTREEVIGKKIWETFWWPYGQEAQAELRSAVSRVAAGQTLRFDVAIKAASGDRVVIDFQMAPIFGDDGEVREIVPSAIDITERVEATERKDMLLAELEHRVKNILATVQAIARFTARMARTREEMAASLTQRLAAISRTHDALTESDWRGQTLRQLVATELAPYAGEDGGRFRYSGDDVFLPPGTALSLGLAFHELATNAAKYGAFSVDGGRVTVEVEAENGDFRRIVWRETGGPEVSPPEHEGFGSFLIGQLLERELGAEIGIVFAKDGLSCTIIREVTDDSVSADST
ncbi:CheR family methyltransferase [Pseudoroseicyclus sp. CXY001]|uniref:CheR family methyltransferase n=1 Tax=Pseudoroseicyclus sp. CXY001 TaxID=3242492 RepID=UPI00358DB2FB